MVDARCFDIQDADFVEIISRRGESWLRNEGFFKAANNFDYNCARPSIVAPELKACAVRVRKVLEFPLEDNSKEASIKAIARKYLYSETGTY